MKNKLDGFPVIIEVPIAWGDMDAFQHVNNTVYFKHFESARIAYFDKINFIDEMNRTGIGPILASTDCRFKLPLTYPDTVSVGAKTERIDDDRFIMAYAVLSHNHDKIAATGTGMLVTFNYKTNTKAPVPDRIKENINSLENISVK